MCIDLANYQLTTNKCFLVKGKYPLYSSCKKRVKIIKENIKKVTLWFFKFEDCTRMSSLCSLNLLVTLHRVEPYTSMTLYSITR